ncbi:hypothetical protein [Kitasatospora sp. NPDC051705]|uniref:hypothetical protein n=1 Tax=Kitasatospora sp. NPDC051705 TaxID=3364057 RepID=UPI00378B273F
MSSPELERINAFLSTFARRQAHRTVDVPGGFAVFDDDFALSYANNQLVVDGTLRTVVPGALPALADEVLGGLPYRVVSVLDDEVARACAQPLAGAGYAHSRYLSPRSATTTPSSAPDPAGRSRRGGVPELAAPGRVTAGRGAGRPGGAGPAAWRGPGRRRPGPRR